MRIKKFNESLETIKLEDIDVYFTYFIDQGRYSSTLRNNDMYIYIEIDIDDNKMLGYVKSDVDSYLEYILFIQEEINIIKDILNKLKIEYDEMYICFILNDVSEHVDDQSNFILQIMLDKPKEGFDSNWTKY